MASPPGRLTRYLGIEATSAIVLTIATIVALVLANSRWADAYASWLGGALSLEVGGRAVAISLDAVIDDGLMALFFFVVGLEIRRELHAGELSEPRRAALPVAAALGGMVTSALLYLAFNPAGPAQRGLGVPMATDIAFAVAALTLLGRRVAPALRVLLLALAILVDIGGVVVIAVFYAEGVVPRGLVVVAMGVVLTLGMQGRGVRSPFPYAVPAVVTWCGFYYAGVHPTMAGVLMGLLTPPHTSYGRGAGSPSEPDDEDEPDEDAPDRPHAAEDRSPAERLQTGLHPYVALLVMPLFAFANAGVALDWVAADARITTGILVGLVVGKPLGIVAVVWLGVRLRLVRLPAGVGWWGVVVVGLVAGVGFTVALFIAGLAFADPAALASAKLGILGGSALAMGLAVVVGRIVLPRTPIAGAAETVEEAERLTDR